MLQGHKTIRDLVSGILFISDVTVISSGFGFLM
jgi:hypothetical protein